jgi:hypothetical protein
LDEHRPAKFRIIETPPGLSVVLQQGPDAEGLNVLHFSRNDLLEREQSLISARRPNPAGHEPATLREPWTLGPTGIQDFFHALGYELDQAGAEMLLIDELEEGVFISYSFVDPSMDFTWHKRSITFSAADIDNIVSVARGRRREEERRGFLSGFKRSKRG